MNPLLPASPPKCQFTSTAMGANELPAEGDVTALGAAPSLSEERSASTGFSAAGLELPQTVDGVPRPRSLDSLRPPAFEPWPAFRDEIASLAQMPGASKTQGLWDAIGHDAPLAAAALTTLAHTVDIAREQALLHIASYAACASVRVQATRHLGDLASVKALDALRELATHPDRGVAMAATCALSWDTAQRLEQAADDPPGEVHRCLRDVVCHIQDREDDASRILLLLSRRSGSDPVNVAEHLTTVAATCHAKVALQAWGHLVQVCQEHPCLQELWRRNLPLLQQAHHRDVARAAEHFPT